jgi:hypothetical protein
VRKGIRVDGDQIELHLAVRWGVSIPEVGAAVQRHVADLWVPETKFGLAERASHAMGAA